MADVVDSVTRSRMMASIRRKDTAPELAVRSYLHNAGLRFRCNDRSLPGTPDIVLPACRVVVLVHGCFWHRHPGCRLAAMPSSRTEFWRAKFDRNLRRDAEVEARLRAAGWVPLVAWECETCDVTKLDELYWRIRASCR